MTNNYMKWECIIKALSILVVLILCSNPSYCQSRVKKRESFSNRIKYVYEIDKSTKLKDGFFICKRNGKILIEGSYKDNRKNGAWHYYHDKKLLLTINYVFDSIVTHHQTELLKEYECTSEQQVYDYIVRNIRKKIVYPMGAAMKNESGTVLMNMELDENGKLLSYKIIKSSGSKHIDFSSKELVKNYHALPYINSCIPKPITLCIPILYEFSSEYERMEYVNKYVKKTTDKWNRRFGL